MGKKLFENYFKEMLKYRCDIANMEISQCVFLFVCIYSKDNS